MKLGKKTKALDDFASCMQDVLVNILNLEEKVKTLEIHVKDIEGRFKAARESWEKGKKELKKLEEAGWPRRLKG